MLSIVWVEPSSLPGHEKPGQKAADGRQKHQRASGQPHRLEMLEVKLAPTRLLLRASAKFLNHSEKEAKRTSGRPHAADSARKEEELPQKLPNRGSPVCRTPPQQVGLLEVHLRGARPAQPEPREAGPATSRLQTNPCPTQAEPSGGKGPSPKASTLFMHHAQHLIQTSKPTKQYNKEEKKRKADPKMTQVLVTRLYLK